MALGSTASLQDGGNDKKEQRKRPTKNSLGSWKRGQGVKMDSTTAVRLFSSNNASVSSNR